MSTTTTTTTTLGLAPNAQRTSWPALSTKEVAKTLLAGPSLVSVDDTENGQTLATLLGTALHANLRQLVLLAPETGIYWASGNASANSAPLVSPGIDIPISKDKADLLKFFAASAKAMHVFQFGFAE